MSAALADYATAEEFEGVVSYESDWYLLLVPSQVHSRLIDLVAATGTEFKPAAKPHVSVMKGEYPNRNGADWGRAFVGEPVRVRVHPVLNCGNGLHFWVDCHSARLSEMREHFGLPTLRRTSDGAYLVNFHFTLGRRKKAVPPTLRDQIRITPASHIDPITGMQHL